MFSVLMIGTAFFAVASTLAQADVRSAEPITVRARDFAFDMPARVPGGLLAIRFVNDGAEPHYMRWLKVDDGRGVEDILKWRAERASMPAWLKAAGGIGTVGPGRSVDLTLRLEPGRYVAMCGHPSPDGTFHAEKGMVRLVEVGPDGGAKAPAATRTLELKEHAMALDRPIDGGRTVFHVVNRGAGNHQALLVKLPAGVTADAELEWFRSGSRGARPGIPAGGVIELSPGAETWFAVSLEPGDYLLICGVGSAQGRHFDRGMRETFKVVK
jgi:uncharacterized cupredoxin-like copper-binding protein